jgi:hypothetical protein
MMDRDKDAESIFEKTVEAVKDMAATVKDAQRAVTPPSVSGRITPTYGDLFASETPVAAVPMVAPRKTRKKTLKTAFKKKAKKAVKTASKQNAIRKKKTAKTVAKKRKPKKSKR